MAVLRIAGEERPGGRPAGAEDRGHAEGAGSAARARPRNDGSSWPDTSRPTASSPRRSARPTARSQADGRSIPAWTLAARVRESAGNLGDAADALRRLAEIDRRNRGEYLTGIARLESRLGRVDDAIKAGRDLLAATSASPEQCEFFAQLCFQHGRVEEGLDALRRAVRANPRDTKAVLTLAETLAGQYQTEEAIEMYWRAFDRAEDLDNKLDVVRRLTELYLQRNQLDRLLTRLQHQERDERPAASTSRPRVATSSMCLAQAYATSGDMGAARSELERLLAANTRDTQPAPAALEARRGGRRRRQRRPLPEAARRAGPQRRGRRAAGPALCPLGRPGRGARASGRRWPRARARRYHVYQAMDSLLFHQKPQPVLETTEAMLRKDPHDWEALYRQRRGRRRRSISPRRPSRSFRALLDADDPRRREECLRQGPRTQSRSSRPPTPTRSSRDSRAMSPMEERLGLATLIRMFCRLEQARRSRRGIPGRRPTSARRGWRPWAGSSAWPRSRATPQVDEVVASFRKPAEKRPADLRALWDWLYLCCGPPRLRRGATRPPATLSRARTDRPAGPLGVPA